MGDQPNEEQPTVPAWVRPPEPTAPLPGLPMDQPPQPGTGAAPGASWPGAGGEYGGGYAGGAYPGPGAPYAAYPPGYPGAPTPPRQNGSRTAVAIISALAVVGTAVTAVVYSTGSNGHQTPAAFQTGAPVPTQTANPQVSVSTEPSDESSATPDTQSTDTFDSSADAFDWNTLNDSSTDPTPFTQDALLPQSFVDSQDITYTLEAAGEKKCVQSTMAQSVQNVLDEYGCKNAMTGSYLVDASVDKVTSNNNILVSIQIWPFADSATADKVEKALAKVSSKQFSIWCPTSGAGAAPCNSQNYYSAATWWSLQSDYRYVVEATAVYTNMTQDTSVAYKWEKTATAEAVKEAGPQVYADSQD